MERKCGKCGELEDKLALQSIDLLEDESSKCPVLYCEGCIKKFRSCQCNRRGIDHSSTFKHHSIILFEKEQKERRHWREKKYVPQLLKEIVIGHMNDGRRELCARATAIANNFEEKKLKEQHTLVGRGNHRQKELPKFLGQSGKEGDGKQASGYRTDWQKGVQMIVEAFRGQTANYV